jgi:hypothetical protein
MMMVLLNALNVIILAKDAVEIQMIDAQVA